MVRVLKMSHSNVKKLFFFFMLTIILTLSYANAVQCEYYQAEAEQAITTAEDRIDEVFIFVLTVEKTGTNIEDLIDKLNTTLNLIRRAQTQFLDGNFSEAIILASNATEIADEVANQADAKKQEVLSSFFLRKYGTLIAFVITDTIVCLIGVFLIHKWLRRSLLNKKPKLTR